MSDAIPLAPRPSIDRYETLAEQLSSAGKSADSGAIHELAVRWLEELASLQNLEITPVVRRQIDAEAHRIEHRWRRSAAANVPPIGNELARARRFLAREHGFASWPEFASHVESLAAIDSQVAAFEMAADAIVGGDLPALERLLDKHPGLVHARSTREHRSTLLHYVSANGIEDFRQRTPPNIVDIAKLLLKAGSEVNAESDAYGGQSTTLGLTATSCHPEHAGVQLQLLDLLIEHGATLDGPNGGSALVACLRNGRGQAAEFLAGRGAQLNLEGAAGVGRLDVVRSFFTAEGALTPPATEQQLIDGFAWACQFGRTSVAEFLLQRGVDVLNKPRHGGQTGLHWAAYGGHTEIVKLLLQRGAPVDVRDDSHEGTPLDWAMYAWGGYAANSPEAQRYYEVVRLLAQAGARIDSPWYEQDQDRQRALDHAHSDPKMQAALQGKMAIS